MTTERAGEQAAAGLGTVFGSIAQVYERGRPTYPDDAVAWLLADPVGPSGGAHRDAFVETEPRHLDVLELGAGTGKLTRSLVAAGHRVLATDPDPRMLAVLAEQVPQAQTAVMRAEDLPVPEASFDVVVIAQAFHWLDPDQALAEVARALRPGGHFAVVDHVRDERVPWVKRLGRVLGRPETARPVAEVLDACPWFAVAETETFKHRQHVDRQSVQDLVLSRSHVAARDDLGRAEVLAETLALYDEYGRGMDGMYVPYLTTCWRTPVVRRPARAADPLADRVDDLAEPDPLTDTMPRGMRGRHAAPPEVVEDDDMMMLIDFR